MSSQLFKLDTKTLAAAAAANDIKSNLFNGSSSTASTMAAAASTATTTTMISKATEPVAAVTEPPSGCSANRFLASFASTLNPASLVTGSCLTSSSNHPVTGPRSRSNSITNNLHQPIHFGKQAESDVHMLSSPSSSSSTSSWGNMFTGILRNQTNNLNCPAPETPKLSSGLVPPKSLPLAPCATSTQTTAMANTACSSMANALSTAFAPLFIEPSEVINKLKNNVIILLDCRTWSEFSTTHIKDSVHLNCRDKITRKRLQTRKVTVKDLISCEEIKSKLESNEAKTSATVAASQTVESVSFTSASIADECPSPVAMAAVPTLQRSSSQLSAADVSGNMIVLYDDTTSELADLQSDANPLKIVQENIKQCGYKKECKILKGGFKEFSKHWPSLCVLKEKSEKLLNAVFCDAQQDQSQAAIENAVMNEIVPHLYLGNEMDAKDESKLEKEGIHYILNVTKNIPFYTNPNNSKFVHKRIAVNDCVSQNLKQHFDEAIQFIEEAKRNKSKVLVHCQAGVSRSPTIVIAYLMQSMHLSMNEALAKVRQIRPIVAPNLIFMSQLSDFESRIQQAVAADAAAVTDENAKPTTTTTTLRAAVAEDVAAENVSAVVKACAAQTQNNHVNTKPMLLLADETNDQIRRKQPDEKTSASSATSTTTFNFDDFNSNSSSSSAGSSDDAEDEPCIIGGVMGGHHHKSHHNANEVLVCN